MQRRRRPRALTLTLPDAKQPYLVMEGKRYTLRNFSEEGIGIWVPTPPPFGLTPGSRVSGDIVIGNHIYSVKLEVVHQSSQLAGLRITGRSDELSGVFSSLLQPMQYAQDLTPQPQSGCEDKEYGHPRLWYAGANGNELVVWYGEHNKMIFALQLIWLGKWVFRERNKSALTGHLRDELRIPSGTVVMPQEFLVRHSKPADEILQEASQILGALNPPLPGYRLWQFLELGEQVYLPIEMFVAEKVA